MQSIARSILCSALLLLCLSPSFLKAQPREGFAMLDPHYEGPKKDTVKVGDSIRGIYPNPNRVALKSAIIPGWGQVVNKDIWKVPIIYAGAATVTYFIVWNHQEYVAYRDAYHARVKGDTLYPDPFKGQQRTLSDQGVLYYREYYHRNRDLSIIIAVGLYAANILDAYVSAHLREFDVSRDLSLSVKPSIFSNIALPGRSFGLSVALKFK